MTTVLEMLFTVPDQKLQDAYMEAKEKAEQEVAETTEPGAHGVYDFEELLTKMYGSYFLTQVEYNLYSAVGNLQSQIIGGEETDENQLRQEAAAAAEKAWKDYRTQMAE